MRIKRLMFLVIVLAAALTAFAQNEKWTTFDGNKIRYYDVGNIKARNALVLVHCWTCNAGFWKDNINAFPGYRVIAMDLPGHGQSDKPKIDYSIDHFARSVDAVMKNAGVKKAVLAGHSMGTPVVRKYYELFPNKTLALVIVDGALLPFGPRDQVDKFFEPLFKDYKNGAATFIDGMLQTADPKVKPFVRESMLSTPDYVAQSAMKLMLDDAYASHGTINVPVLATMAPNPYWPNDIEARYKAAAPKMEFQAWSGVSHFLQMERPAMFNGQVKGFIIRNKLL